MTLVVISNIKSVICPHCRDVKLVLRRPSENAQNEDTWNCLKCNHFFPWYFFDTFKQYEKFVERSE